MKTLALLTCLLAISYAADPQKLKEFYDNSANCINELNVQQPTPEVVKCILQKDEMIDENGVVRKEKLLAHLETLISDETNLDQAKEIVTTCHSQAYQGPGNNDEKTMTSISCAMHILDLFDKPQ